MLFSKLLQRGLQQLTHSASYNRATLTAFSPTLIAAHSVVPALIAVDKCPYSDYCISTGAEAPAESKCLHEYPLVHQYQPSLSHQSAHIASPASIAASLPPQQCSQRDQGNVSRRCIEESSTNGSKALVKSFDILFPTPRTISMRMIKQAICFVQPNAVKLLLPHHQRQLIREPLTQLLRAPTFQKKPPRISDRFQ